MELLLKFYSDCFETLQVFSLVHGLKMRILFGHNPQITFGYYFYKINLVIFGAKVNIYKLSGVLSCFMIAHIFKDKQKVVGDINYLNFFVLYSYRWCFKFLD